MKNYNLDSLLSLNDVEKGNVISVRDDGRGMPVGIHHKMNLISIFLFNTLTMMIAKSSCPMIEFLQRFRIHILFLRKKTKMKIAERYGKRIFKNICQNVF